MGWQFDIQGKKKAMLSLWGFHKATAKTGRIELATPLVICKCSFPFSWVNLTLLTRSFCTCPPCFSFRDCSKLPGCKPEYQLQQMPISDMLWHTAWWDVLLDCDSHTPCRSSDRERCCPLELEPAAPATPCLQSTAEQGFSSIYETSVCCDGGLGVEGGNTTR